MTADRFELLFEVWSDPQGDHQMLEAGREADEFRARVSPGMVLVHSFTAVSNFDAFQKNYDCFGYGRWKPEPDWEERFFTKDDYDKQQQSLAQRVSFQEE